MWVLQAVSDQPFRFCCSEIGEVVMSLGQYFDIIVKRLSLSRGGKCDRTDSIRNKGGKIIEEKAESKKVMQKSG